MLVLRNILNQWDELWRYPDLVVALEQTDAEDFSPKIFAKGLIVGLASLRSPQECLLSLLRGGEFQSAERVLDSASFEAAVNPDDHEALFQELDKARRDAAEEVRARTAALQARASRVGLPGMVPVDVVEKRVPESQSLLDGWEVEIRRREAEVRESSSGVSTRPRMRLTERRRQERLRGKIRWSDASRLGSTRLRAFSWSRVLPEEYPMNRCSSRGDHSGRGMSRWGVTAHPVLVSV